MNIIQYFKFMSKIIGWNSLDGGWVSKGQHARPNERNLIDLSAHFHAEVCYFNIQLIGEFCGCAATEMGADAQVAGWEGEA
ncbi:MAG: hypothetical protein ACRC6I_03000 [Paracoccaceae bacterium]